MITSNLEVIEGEMSRVCEELCPEPSTHRASPVLLLLGLLFLEGMAFALGLKVGEAGGLEAVKAEGSVSAGHQQPLLTRLCV